MDKEQLIRELKYTKEKHKNDKLHTFDTDISAMCSDILDVLSRCVEIPDNATNGDVIKAMFDVTERYHVGLIDVFGIDNYVTISNGWWYAPYQKGENNE